MSLTELLNYNKFLIVLILIVGQVTYSFEVHIYKNEFISSTNVTDYIDNSSNVSSRLRRQNTNANRNCEIPNYLPNLFYKILGESGTIYKPKDYVDEYSILEIICDKGYKLPPRTQNMTICINGQWNNPPQNCLRTCPSLMSTKSTTVKCFYKNIPLESCTYPVDGTRVYLSCNTFYEAEELKRNPIRTCSNGKWIPRLTECYATCGIKSPKAMFNIINGTNTTQGDYPWQVAVYTNKKDFICGGSIIDHNIILSAAHCFTNYTGNTFPAENYLIAAGKYYRQYDDDRDELVQYSKVREIFVPAKYKSIYGLNGFDIAVVLLEDSFTLTRAVLPVCIDLNEVLENTYYIHINGTVTGWGYTQEGRVLADELKELVIPYIPFDKCYAEVPQNFQKFIMFDKICGGYLKQGTSICEGDSGGGLVYNIDNKYFIKGIVSTSPISSESAHCNSHQYGLYTSIYHHRHFVQDIVASHGWNQVIECARDDCRNENTEDSFRDSCVLPNFPQYGKYSFLATNNKYEPGDYVHTNAVILLSCDTGYKVNPSGAAQFDCKNTGEWMPALGTCTPLVENNRTSIPIFSTTPTPPDVTNHRNIRFLPSNSDCGFVNSDSHIWNGNKTTPDEFPWVTLLSYQTKTGRDFRCGGTLINNRYVLTAAHCITSLGDLTLRAVRLGDPNIASVQNCALEGKNITVCAKRVQNIIIEEIIPHPNFSDTTYNYDIGLLRLNSPAKLNGGVQPICLPIAKTLNNKKFTKNDVLVVSGWGSTKTSTIQSVDLLKGEIFIVPEAECKTFYSRTSAEINHKQMCVASRNRKDLCVGDSGGPLQSLSYWDGNVHFVQYGIKSFVPKDCNQEKSPGVFTRLDYYMDWILDNIRV